MEDKEKDKVDRTERTERTDKADRTSFLDCIKIAAITYIIVSVIINFVIINIQVPSGSMMNTINIGDNIIADRLFYKINGIQRGDIVVFVHPDSGKIYIKRAIGLPGEKIEGKNGYVYINGKKLKETYVRSKLKDDFGPYTILDDSYFMMGDNRTDSYDSRFWIEKFVSSDKIIGVAKIRYKGGFKIFSRPKY